MKIDVFAENGKDMAALGASFEAWLGQYDRAPDFVALHKSVACRDAGLSPRLADVRALHGATSCLGVMSTSFVENPCFVRSISRRFQTER